MSCSCSILEIFIIAGSCSLPMHIWQLSPELRLESRFWTQQVQQLCEVQLPAAGELPRCRCLAHVTPGQDNVGQAWEKGQCMAYTSPQDALLRCSRMSLNTWYNYIFVFENIASNASSDLICQLRRHTVDYTQSCRAVRHKQQTEKPLELT